MKFGLSIVSCCSLSILVTASTLTLAETPLPGGAQAINETYQDWQVNCTLPQGIKHCAITQQQMDDKTKQRVLAVELQPRGDKAEGVAILPFGLAIDKGVSVKIGDAEIGPPLRFKTCLPQGCVLPLSFDFKALALLRKGPAISLGVLGDTDQPATLSISLGGFAAAFDRAATLAR